MTDSSVGRGRGHSSQNPATRHSVGCLQETGTCPPTSSAPHSTGLHLLRGHSAWEALTRWRAQTTWIWSPPQLSTPGLELPQALPPAGWGRSGALSWVEGFGSCKGGRWEQCLLSSPTLPSPSSRNILQLLPLPPPGILFPVLGLWDLRMGAGNLVPTLSPFLPRAEVGARTHTHTHELHLTPLYPSAGRTAGFLIGGPGLTQQVQNWACHTEARLHSICKMG